MSAQALELMQRAQHVIHHAETHLHRLQRARAIDAQAISLHRQCARRTLMVWHRAAHAQAELRRAMTRRHHHAALVMWRLWNRGHRKQCLHRSFTQWLCFTFMNMSLSSCSAASRHDDGDEEDDVRRRSLSYVRSVMTKRMQAKQTLSRVIWRRIMMEHDVLQRLYVRCFMTWKLSIHFQTLVDENHYLHDELRIKNMMMDGLCQTLRCLPDHHHHLSDVHGDDDGAQAADYGKCKRKKKLKKNSQSASGT